MNGDEHEMSITRTGIEKMVQELFVSIPEPAVWLIFRVVLHLMNKPIVTVS